MKNKIIAGLAALGIVGVSVIVWAMPVDINELPTKKISEEECVDDRGISMIAEEELVTREYKEGKVIETSKICFKNKSDYEKYKDDLLKTYTDKTPEERAKYILTKEGRSLGDVLTHETQKLPEKKVQFELKAGDDMILKYIEAINK